MGEPVVPFGEGHLGLRTAIPIHFPALHQSGAGRIEPDLRSIRGILRAIIKAGTGGQLPLLAAIGTDGINIHFKALSVVTEGTVAKLLGIRGPAMEETGIVGGNQPGRAPFDGKNIDLGHPAGIGMADSQLFVVTGKHMVIVAGCALSGIDQGAGIF